MWRHEVKGQRLITSDTKEMGLGLNKAERCGHFHVARLGTYSVTEVPVFPKGALRMKRRQTNTPYSFFLLWVLDLAIMGVYMKKGKDTCTSAIMLHNVPRFPW